MSNRDNYHEFLIGTGVGRLLRAEIDTKPRLKY